MYDFFPNSAKMYILNAWKDERRLLIGQNDFIVQLLLVDFCNYWKSAEMIGTLFFFVGGDYINCNTQYYM